MQKELGRLSAEAQACARWPVEYGGQEDFDPGTQTGRTLVVENLGTMGL